MVFLLWFQSVTLSASQELNIRSNCKEIEKKMCFYGEREKEGCSFLEKKEITQKTAHIHYKMRLESKSHYLLFFRHTFWFLLLSNVFFSGFSVYSWILELITTHWVGHPYENILIEELEAIFLHKYSSISSDPVRLDSVSLLIN